LAASGLDPDVARRALDHQLEQLARARRSGVAVALGTDAGSPGVHHGKGTAAELRLLIRAGFSIEEAIRCAAANGFALIGAPQGVLAPGRPATFVVVPGEPSGLPENLLNVHAVYIDGRCAFPLG
jgi:imidazolonepropionase-like amidohydrolase